MCFRPHMKGSEDLVLLLDNLVFQGLNSPIISCLLFTTVYIQHLLFTAVYIYHMTPYCFQRDLASSIKHNAHKQIPQCLVRFREQHHTYIMSFGIMASQSPNFQLWLLQNSLFFQAQSYSTGPIVCLCRFLQNPYNQCSAYLLLESYAQLICSVFIKQVISVLAKGQFNCTNNFENDSSINTIVLYICALKFTL